MALVDLPLDELRAYRPPLDEPADFDAFWSSTLAESRAKRSPAVVAEVTSRLETIQAFDVTFSGFDGQPIKAWLLHPAGAAGPAADDRRVHRLRRRTGATGRLAGLGVAGYAHLVMDTRGQGGTWRSGRHVGHRGERHGPEYPGVMTRGILDPATYYYRRLMTDAVLAVEAARDLPVVDGSRIAVCGASQGGGLALAAPALAPGVIAAIADVPFLCHYRRAVEVTDELPYAEICGFLRSHRREEAQVFRTLGYFDGRSFAARATVPALFSVGLED